MHLDVEVDDLDEAEAAVLQLGASQARSPTGDELSGLRRPRRTPVLPLLGLNAKCEGCHSAWPSTSSRPGTDCTVTSPSSRATVRTAHGDA